MNPIKILHITPHLGGGVGRVLLNYFSKVNDDIRFIHQIACLDYANENTKCTVKNFKLRLSDSMSCNYVKLKEMIAEADIVLVHWWNHPLLFDFLVRIEMPPSRIIFWSHISGFNAPYVFSNKALSYPDLFVFSSPISLETKEVKSFSEEDNKSLKVIWSTSGVEHVRNIKHKRHSGFNVGYIGTVDYCKLHPDFLSLCSKIDVPDVSFIVCGGDKNKEISIEAEQLGLSSKIKFTGLVNNINQYLEQFDVFGYPLAPYHYGTCDQALAESMATGVVPVVLSNRMERYMVKDGLTGIVAKNQEEYINAIQYLFQNKELRLTLANNAKKYAIQTFSIDTLIQEWNKTFEEVLYLPKTKRVWDFKGHNTEISAKDVFIESLGSYGQIFLDYCNAKSIVEKKNSENLILELGRSPLWQSDTRGTIHHYHQLFPKDQYLANWSKLLKEC